MITQFKLGNIAAERHQEHPSQRLSAQRQRAHFGPVANEAQYHPCFCHLETWIKQQQRIALRKLTIWRVFVNLRKSTAPR